jgi:hypothetical protein
MLRSARQSSVDNDCLGPSGLGRLDRPGWSGANAPKTVFPTLGEA